MTKEELNNAIKFMQEVREEDNQCGVPEYLKALDILLSLARRVLELDGEMEGIIARVYGKKEHSHKVLDANLIQSITRTLRERIWGRCKMLEPTGFCWKCGLQCKEGELFCSKKHQEQYERVQDRKIIRGKKAGYGLAGSMH